MILEFVGKFYDNHSLSIVNRNIVKEFAKNPDITVILMPLDSYDPVYKVDKSTVKLLKSLEVNNSEKPADIQLRHSYPPIWSWPSHEDTKVVYIQPWEYSKVPFEWQYKFETFADGLIVPSNYCKDVFIKGGINPENIFTVPNGYNPSIFNREASTESLDKYGIKDSRFNFVYVGNSQWRKNINTLLNVWANTFKKCDNATLIIKDNPKVYGETNILSELIKLQYKSECAEIIYIDDDLSDSEVAAIYKASKAVVHPYRAEGFGMHIQEAMACGCIPVVPDKGPTEDFIPKDIGFKIATRPIVIDIEDPNIFATKKGDSMSLMSTHTVINEPQSKSLQDIMGYFYHTHNNKEIIDKLAKYSMNNTWNNVASTYVDILTKVSLKTKTNRNK